MKFFVIGDQQTVLGLRLVGVEGAVVTGREEALAALDGAVGSKDTRVILLTEKVAMMVRDAVDSRLYGFGFPLVLEIPDMSGPHPNRATIDSVVRHAIGISI